MRAVMEAEIALGNDPTDVSADNLGYDIESHDPREGRLRFIEVKGRRAGATTVTMTRNEILKALNVPERYILAIVQVGRRPGCGTAVCMGAGGGGARILRGERELQA